MDRRDETKKRKMEVYERATRKKPRYFVGLIMGSLFIGIGAVFLSTIVVFGGAVIVIISVMNLAACRYAEKQLRMIDRKITLPIADLETADPAEEKGKSCTYCGKRIDLGSKYCEWCGKKQ